jgi:glycosyltransferase involved in cell wall biosynthesis
MSQLVSVIMPVHNGEKYIVESVNSILKQTYKHLELIIVDTGSEDKTFELVSDIKDERIKILRTTQDVGLTGAFFQGYKASSGDFITRHDSDDTSSENRFKTQVDYLLMNPEFGMVSCLIKCVTDVERYRRACLFIERLQNSYKDVEAIENAVMGDFIPIIFPTLLIRRELIEKVGIKEKLEGFDGQIDLLLRLLKESKVEKINKILYSYRRHDKAYHIINEDKDYNSAKALIKDNDINNHLKYRQYFKEKTSTVYPKENRNTSLRVLMLVDALNVGGTETHVLHMAKELMKLGIHVVVGTSGGPLVSMFEFNGIKIYKVPLDTDYISNKNLYSCIRAVKDIVDEEKIDLIHAHLFASMSIASEISKRYNVPYVTTIHGLFYPNDILFTSCYNADAIVAVSRPTARMIYTKMGEEVANRLYVVPNGVNTEEEVDAIDAKKIRKELGIGSKDIVIAYCSRLAWQKTLAAENFIFGFYKLTNNYENIHAIVIGDGDEKKILEREAKMLNESARRTAIHVVGAQYNVLDYYQASDIVVGTGRVALEAMSCGKPVIAVGNHGYVGIVQDESRDLLWKTYFGDHSSLKSPDLISIYTDMKYLVENTDERIKIGEWSRRWCREMFDIKNIARQTFSIYKNAIYNKSEPETTSLS